MYGDSLLTTALADCHLQTCSALDVLVHHSIYAQALLFCIVLTTGEMVSVDVVKKHVRQSTLDALNQQTITCFRLMTK